jgi:hypothetical protein
MYRMRNTGELKTKAEIIKLNPNTSLPKEWKAATHDSLNVDFVLNGTKPTISSNLKTLRRNTPVQNSEGNWEFTWQEVAIFDTPEQEAVYLERQVEQNKAAMREKRDEMLSRTDWMALSDVTMSAEWQAYRQALRDVPEQEGFPDNIVWPTKPE